MFGVIQINQLEFLSAISQIQATGSEITSGLEAFPDYQSDSQALTQYKEQYEALKVALANYQELLARDLTMILQAGNALQQAENQLLK